MVHQETISSIFLHSGKKSETNPDLLKIFMSCSCRLSAYLYSGSKDKERVGCAVLRENDHQTMRIPDGSSIFTTEAKAIDHTAQEILIWSSQTK